MRSGISVIIGYRNREISRVQNCLESLANQTVTDFELVFIDYGSDFEISNDIKSLVQTYPFTKYYYNETRGWYWNRAHALNTGLRFAQGEIILFADIDLVLDYDFVEKLLSLHYNKQFYTFQCYYLAEDVEISNITKTALELSTINYVGLCAASREVLIDICGFDEFYMSWGGEDDDLYARLVKAGYKWNKVSIEEFPVFHQWHKTHSPKYPTLWYLEMVTRLYSDTIRCTREVLKFGCLVNIDNRPVLKHLNDYKSFFKLELFPNPTFQFNLFLDSFFRMKSGEFGYFELILPSEAPKGRKQKLVDSLNKKLNWFNTSYFIGKKKLNLPLHDKKLWEDFVMYFIGKHRNLISDYYIIESSKRLLLVLQKK